MNKGTVKRFNSPEGLRLHHKTKRTEWIFSFIFPGIASNGFKSLEEGQAVTFDITNSPKRAYR